MILGDSTWPDLEGRRPILVLPVGSTEQHGPHLPLDTDMRVAMAVSLGLADRLTPLLVAPALPFGASGEHAGFPGTLSLGTEVLARVMIEIVRSADDTASGVVLVNGHGGNLEGLRQATSVLGAEGRRVLLWAPTAALARAARPPRPATPRASDPATLTGLAAPADPAGRPGPAGTMSVAGDLHAGRTETSLLLHLAPQHVRLDRATAGPVPSLDALVAHGVAALSSSGVLGDPTGASAAEGACLLAAYIDHATEHLLAWAARSGIPAPRRRTAHPTT
ncbi:Mycofactocin precursor peptide peptidase [Frankia sp. AiPs1]|uniref:mycofactocin biosynthesis peptidyl-dipeptidase MftE n=1 Tax=Frankia sp. AiPa1 TaxID=573492 RepID=UPI00202AC7B4|nr:mycofactocin biosynthesis peptidyl-dipeptidase MftE [Frankia sp. AiPa1]MCL9761126.1 mycofactocin biosynthesis peptidyl-dipeptidase MftE [Frankia sp. AiPa1]